MSVTTNQVARAIMRDKQYYCRNMIADKFGISYLRATSIMNNIEKSSIYNIKRKRREINKGRMTRMIRVMEVKDYPENVKSRLLKEDRTYSLLDCFLYGHPLEKAEVHNG